MKDYTKINSEIRPPEYYVYESTVFLDLTQYSMFRFEVLEGEKLPVDNLVSFSSDDCFFPEDSQISVAK